MTAAEIAALDALHAKAFAGCQRGCEGRHFSCTCGADEAVEGVLDAWPAVSAELRALRAGVAELEDAIKHALYTHETSGTIAPSSVKKMRDALKGRTDGRDDDEA